MFERTVSPADLARLARQREDAEREYNDALTRLDRALPRSFQAQPEPAAPDAGALAGLDAPTAALPPITVDRLALLPLPYGTLAVSPCTTRTLSMDTWNSSATIWLNAVAMPWPTELMPE